MVTTASGLGTVWIHALWLPGLRAARASPPDHERPDGIELPDDGPKPKRLSSPGYLAALITRHSTSLWKAQVDTLHSQLPTYLPGHQGTPVSIGYPGPLRRWVGEAWSCLLGRVSAASTFGLIDFAPTRPHHVFVPIVAGHLRVHVGWLTGMSMSPNPWRSHLVGRGWAWRGDGLGRHREEWGVDRNCHGFDFPPLPPADQPEPDASLCPWTGFLGLTRSV